MKITLITVSYNSSETIRETFESVRAQRKKCFELEYIHVDGLSSDSTMDISMEFDDIITKRISEKDSGIYNAMNKGIKLATGDIIAFLNSDDTFADKEILEKIAYTFCKNPEIEIVYGDVNYVTKEGSLYRRWRTGIQRSFAIGWHPAHPAFYAKKSLYENYGDFDETFPIAADFDIMLRFMEIASPRTYYLKKAFVDMKIGGESNASISNINKARKEIESIFRKYGVVKMPFYTVFRWSRKLIQRFLYV